MGTRRGTGEGAGGKGRERKKKRGEEKTGTGEENYGSGFGAADTVHDGEDVEGGVGEGHVAIALRAFIWAAILCSSVCICHDFSIASNFGGRENDT